MKVSPDVTLKSNQKKTKRKKKKNPPNLICDICRNQETELANSGWINKSYNFFFQISIKIKKKAKKKIRACLLKS